MKKLLTALVLGLLVCLLVTPVSAAEANTVISSPEDTLYRGDTFTITAVLNNTEEIGLGTVVLMYDDSVFEMTGGKCYVSGANPAQVLPGQKVGTFFLANPTVVSGTIFTFEMRVKEDALFGAYSINSITSIGENALIPSSGIRITVDCHHDYQDCTRADEENHQSICSVCGDVLTQAHNWEDTEILQEADCKTPGIKKQTCSDCDAEQTADIPLTENHRFGDWSETENSHTRICSVCGREEALAHTWDAGRVTEKATCQETGTRIRTCTACGAEKTETIAKTGHSYPTYTVLGADGHKAICADCGYELTEAHDFGKDWKEDSANHYKQCADCGYIGEKQAHTPDAAGEVCTVCKRKLLSDHTHTFAEQWIGDATGHWHFCTSCQERSDFEAHVYDDDCDARCNLCNEKREPVHNPEGELESDETGHWYLCSDCGAKTGIAAHIPGDKATNSKPQTCTECGFVIKPVLAHEHYPDTTHTHMCECGETYVADAETCVVCREAHKQFPWWIVCILEFLVFGGVIAYLFLPIGRGRRYEEDLW